MKRREFITLLGGATAWPRAARAQQPTKLPTIGFWGSNASVWTPLTAAFVERLRALGWIEGRTVAIDYLNTRLYVQAGALMSYGTNFADQFRRAAEIVDKILRGTKPGDIPVEQPTKFELVINLTTANALGLKIPEAFLLRADELIE